MATKIKNRSAEARTAKAVRAASWPGLNEAAQWSNDQLSKLDIAAMNLLCASGLRGAGGLNLSELLSWIDEAANMVRVITGENYDRLLQSPEMFNHSQANFCMRYLVTVLQRKCNVYYNPKWRGLTPDIVVPHDFGADANNLFIHAIINGLGGTCGSLPVLYVAVGRRLGYPLKLVKAYRHLFIRWDDPNGRHWPQAERFNVEATGPGVHFLADDHYKTWPHNLPKDDITAGIFLKSLSPREELAEFLAARSYCLQYNNHLYEAINTMSWASQLAPHNRYFSESHNALSMHWQLFRRSHAFINAAPPNIDEMIPRGPYRIPGPDGQDYLIQVVQPGHYNTPTASVDINSLSLQHHMVQLPTGEWAEVQVPLHGSGRLTEAKWITFPNGDVALVHKSTYRCVSSPKRSAIESQPRNGQPVLPTRSSMAEISPQDRYWLIGVFQHLQWQGSVEAAILELPRMNPLALPPDPAPKQPVMSSIGGRSILL